MGHKQQSPGWKSSVCLLKGHRWQMIHKFSLNFMTTKTLQRWLKDWTHWNRCRWKPMLDRTHTYFFWPPRDNEHMYKPLWLCRDGKYHFPCMQCFIHKKRMRTLCWESILLRRKLVHFRVHPHVVLHDKHLTTTHTHTHTQGGGGTF